MLASSLALDMALLARDSAAAAATANNGASEAEAKVKTESDLLRSPLGQHNNPHHHQQGERRLPFSINNILSQQQVSCSES